MARSSTLGERWKSVPNPYEMTRPHMSGKGRVREVKTRSTLAIAAAFLSATALLAGMAGAAPKATITFGGASAGGSLQLASSAWAGFIMKNHPEFLVNVETTGGALDNFRLINTGEVDLGWVDTPTQYDGKKGLGWAKGRKYLEVNTCIPWYLGKTEMWTVGGKKLTKLSDLNGKVISPGPAAGPANFILRAVVQEFGLKPRRIATIGWGDAINQQKDGLIEVATVSTISPWGALKDLELTHKVNFFYLSRAELERIVKKNPKYSIATTKRGTYKNLERDGESLAWVTAIMCKPRLDADLVYKLVKATFEKKEELTKLMGVYGTQLGFENIKFGNVMPFHPGAARYYKEKGMQLPKMIE